MQKVKKILVGACGSSMSMILPYYIHRLLDECVETVEIALTTSAQKFVSPLSLEVLAKRKVWTTLWDRHSDALVPHMDLARSVDLVLVLPASAGMISRVAMGSADDLISLVVLATKKPVILAPSMNEDMWNSKAVQRNCRLIADLGHTILEPKMAKSLSDSSERLGGLASFEDVVSAIKRALAPP